MRLEPLSLQNEEDLQWLYQFIRSHHSAPASVLPSYDNLRHAKQLRFFRAIDEQTGEVVGISSYDILTAHLVETKKTIVEPRFRGKGWGKTISQAIEDEVRKAGFKKIRTTIYVDNLAMIGIKLEQGYRIEGFHPDHEAPGLHEYSLGKLLT